MINLRALKPTGALHQTWQGELLTQSKEWLVVYTPAGTAVRHHTKDLSYTMEHSNLGIFSAQEYYNIFIDFHPDKSFKRLYINVAEPASWNDNEVSWVDLELDIVLYPGKEPELLDEDEFAETQANGQIQPALARRVQKVAAVIMDEAASGKFPFLALGYEEAVQEIRRHMPHEHLSPK